MSADQSVVTAATELDREAMKATLGAAFWDDPVWRYSIGQGRRFERRIGALIDISARPYLADNTIFRTAGCEAFAVWNPPPGPRPERVADQLTSLPTAVWAAGRHSLRGLRLWNAMKRQHPHDEPHWYLAVLGTRPAAQGHGFGSAVLRPVLERCDSDGVGAYLESSKFENIAFYERHGFRVRGTLDVPDGCPPIWPMWRDPQPTWR